MTGRGKSSRSSRGRPLARKLAMQALYQWQLGGQSAGEIAAQFEDDAESAGVDRAYFEELLTQVIERHQRLDAIIAEYADRPIAQLDPVEHAILLIGLYELTERLEIPFRVVINEAVQLSKRFGATDGHRYVNALLDQVARQHRAPERSAGPPAAGSS
jgi:N utilization substance protein B